MEGLTLERVPKSNEMANRRGGKPEARVKIDLLIGRDLEGRPKMQEMLRCATLGKVTGVLDERVPAIRVLPVEQKTGLAG